MSKIITKRGSKNPVQVIPGSGKEQFTVLALANASGTHYSPFLVFTGKNLYVGRSKRCTVWYFGKWMDGH